MIKLIELSIDNGKDVYEMLQRLGPSENAFRNDVNGMSYQEYQDWLKIQAAWARGDQLPDGYVRQWTYWLYDNDTPVGYGKLRERVTEQSLKFGGNLGMAIDPLARGRVTEILFSKSSLNRPPKMVLKKYSPRLRSLTGLLKRSTKKRAVN